VDCINVAQDRDRWRALVNMVMKLLVPRNAGNISSTSQTISFSGRTLFRGIKKLVVFEADTDISSTG